MVGSKHLLSSAAAFALLLLPSVAQAQSHGFDIVNRTGGSLRLTDVSTSGGQPFETVDGIARRPLVGLLLAPNSPAYDVELSPALGTKRKADLRFAGPNGVVFTVHLSSEPQVDSEGYPKSVGVARCSVNAPGSQCLVDDDHPNHPIITMLDPPGTTRTVPETEAQRQFQVLWDLCRDGGPTHCAFAADPGEAVPTYAESTVVGQPVLNCGSRPVTDKYAVDHVTHSSASVGIEIGFSVDYEAVLLEVEGSLTGTTEHKWGWSSEFKQTYTIPVLPRHIAYVALTVPVVREFGTFTAQINNTTWTLKHISFDTPDPGRAGAPPDQIVNRVATGGELAACDKRSGLVPVTPSRGQGGVR